MAIVPNRGNVYEPVDVSYCTHTRTMAGMPAVVPTAPGEIVLDSTNHVRWRAVGKLTGEWVPIETEVT